LPESLADELARLTAAVEELRDLIGVVVEQLVGDDIDEAE